MHELYVPYFVLGVGFAFLKWLACWQFWAGGVGLVSGSDVAGWRGCRAVGFIESSARVAEGVAALVELMHARTS